MNRRVEVKVLVNQGLVAGAGNTENPATKPPGDPSK
jgi:hypothetical protein